MAKKQVYRFRYVTTALSGEGITEYPLPEFPGKEKCLFSEYPAKEQYWRRTPLPADWEKWRTEEAVQLAKNPDYVHPKLNAFIAQEWDRRNNGVWLMVDGKPHYLPGPYYYYLNWWNADFGYPRFRFPDLEVFYLLDFAEHDPSCYGIALNTRRRYGKSAIMGAWQVEYITRNEKSYAGNQGETEPKIKDFFALAVVNPFRKLPDFFQPVYNTEQTQIKSLEFFAPIKRGRRVARQANIDQLESRITYQKSDETAYDGKKLHRYVVEEPGKPNEADVRERHDIVKKCLLEDTEDGMALIGKMFYATTVEDMEDSGKVYETLFYDSDYNKREVDGCTKSGLFAAFIPSYFTAAFDKYGVPDEAKNRLQMGNMRESQKANPRAYAGEIRKNPFTVKEIFYVSANKCVFNAMVLQNQKDKIIRGDVRVERGDFDWKNKVKDSKVLWIPNSRNGRCQVAWLPDKDEETNLVRAIGEIDDVIQWEPLNSDKFTIGHDPVQHGHTVDNKRSSRPVGLVKRLYDAGVDGRMPEVDLEGFLKQKQELDHQWETNKYIVLYDYKPEDPNIYYEYMIKICVFFGCQIFIEDQKRAIIDHFVKRGYKKFLMTKYKSKPEAEAAGKEFLGTPASQGLTQDYTSFMATYIEYFGHTIPFLDVIEDCMFFDPMNTKDYDYAVAMGNTELACQKPVKIKPKLLDLSKFLPIYQIN